MKDDHVLLGGVLLGADKPLERSVLDAGILVEEERGHDAPARDRSVAFITSFVKFSFHFGVIFCKYVFA